MSQWQEISAMETTLHPPGKPSKRPVIVGAAVGGTISAGFGLLINFLLGTFAQSDGGAVLALSGGAFLLFGACLGAFVGAIIRESRARKDEGPAQRGRLRVILLLAGVGAILLLAWWAGLLNVLQLTDDHGGYVPFQPKP